MSMTFRLDPAAARMGAPWSVLNPFISGAESPSLGGRSDAAQEAEDFARAAIFVICSTGVSASQARRIYGRCLAALAMGGTARMGFRHPTKAEAIDAIWRDRDRHYRRYRAAADKMAALKTLPWIGPVTVQRLALALELFDSDGSEADGPEDFTGVVTNAF